MTINTQHWKGPFFTIAIGQAFSLIGSSAVQFALIWWLASKTGSPLMMAMAGLVAFLPQAFLGPFAGVWIDRLKRKYVTIAADMFIGLAALFFAAVFYYTTPPYWSVCLVLGVRALGSVFHTPAIQAIVPMLVPAHELVRANGWSQFMQSGAFMLGPVLGAAMYGFWPMWLILVTDFVGALIASIAMLIVKVPEIQRQPDGKKPNFWRELKEGAAVYRQDPKLCTLLIAATASMVFFLPLSSLYPLMTSSYFQATAYHASLVEFLYAAGMMGSAFIVGLFGKVQRKLLMAYLGLLGLGATAVICGLLPSQMWAFWIFAPVCGLMGACGNFYSIPSIAYMQETLPPEAMGRAFSLLGSVMSLAMPLGLLISGPIAEKYGVSHWFLVTGVAICLINSLAMAYSGKRHR